MEESSSNCFNGIRITNKEKNILRILAILMKVTYNPEYLVQ